MNGLLEKDIRLIIQRKREMLTFLIIAVVLGVSQNGIFVIAFLTLVCTLLLVGTISNDEGGYAFLQTLPITKKIYVREKYLLCFGGGTISFLAAAALCIVGLWAKSGTAEELRRMVSISGMMYPALGISIAVMIPIELKFGAEGSRMVLTALFGLCLAAVYLAAGILSKAGISAENLLVYWKEIPPFAAGAGMYLAAAAVLGISYCGSLSILKKKEV